MMVEINYKQKNVFVTIIISQNKRDLQAFLEIYINISLVVNKLLFRNWEFVLSLPRQVGVSGVEISACVRSN